MARLAALVRRAGVPLVYGVFLFLLLNGALELLGRAFSDVGRFATRDPINTLKARPLEDCYPGWTRREIDALLEETWSRTYRFEAYTHFTERAKTGRYVNVDAAGFRHGKTKAPWPPEPEATNVFFFGGSTTFGYGLPDGETVPALLEDELAKLPLAKPPRVYNFGRGCYFSSQEAVLFLRLLAEGRRPDVAVFLDGLNDFAFFDGLPDSSGELARFHEDRVQATEDLSALARLVGRLPVVALARRLGPRPKPAFPNLEAWNRPDLYDPVLDRYLRVQRLVRAVARDAGTAPLFVWQPVPTYRYEDPGHRRLADGSFGLVSLSAFGYPAFAKRLEKSPAAPDFFWAADLQEGLEGSLYVDMVHYSKKLSRVLAERIARELHQRKAL